MKKRAHGVFISYRRDGGDGLAGRVRDALRARGFPVFFDVEDLKSGKFNAALYAEIERCFDFIVILSPGALDRCVNEGDWVRLEIAHALKLKKNIVPIFGRNFEFPKSPLPADIAELCDYNGLPASHELFEASMDKLARMLISPKTENRKRWAPLAAAIAVLLVSASLFFLRTHKAQSAPPPVVPSLPPTPAATAAGPQAPASTYPGQSAAVPEGNTGSVQLTKNDIRPQLTQFYAPRWHISVDIHPRARDSLDIKGSQYSFDGKTYKQSEVPLWLTLGLEAYDKDRLFFKLELWDGSVIGPFEYSFDFKGFAFAKMKEYMADKPLLAKYSDLFSWTPYVTENLPAIEYIEASETPDFSKARKVLVPKMSFIDYYRYKEANHGDMENPDLSPAAATLHVRASFIDGTKGRIQTFSGLTPDFIKSPHLASTSEEQKAIILFGINNLLEGFRLSVDMPAEPAETSVPPPQNNPSTNGLSSDQQIVREAEKRAKEAGKAAQDYERRQRLSIAKSRFEHEFADDPEILAKLPTVVFRPNIKQPLGPWQSVKEVRYGLSESRLDRVAAANRSMHWAEIRRKDDPGNAHSYDAGMTNDKTTFYQAWHLFLPADTSALYARVVFTDGTLSDVVRYPVVDKKL